MGLPGFLQGELRFIRKEWPDLETDGGSVTARKGP